MTIWIIEPHSSLIFRDGRPFGPNPGARAKSLSFPFPSATTGGVRTRAGLVNGIFEPTNKNIEEVKKISVRGPLLVQLSLTNNTYDIEDWMLPAPIDALLFERTPQSTDIEIKQLVPLSTPNEVLTDFDSKNVENLHLVGLEHPDNRKPARNTPRYWSWDTFQKWLSNPNLLSQQVTEVAQLGHNGPQYEQRLHVSIDPETGAAKDGALFETSGLEFTRGKQIHEAKRLALAVEVDEEGQGKKIEQGLTHLGGERRMVKWHKSDKAFPECSKELEDAIVKTGACRMFLLTPAYFTEGYLPAQLRQPRDGVTPELQAIAIQRPQVLSGWDLEKKGPKPTRRLAPAGTVLFFKLGEDAEANRKWIRGTWMQCISDTEQDCKDGFGLAVLGTWSGEQVPMKG